MFDFPQYYNLFGRQQTEAFGRRINNTNRLLGSYRGTDGIKTGYTRAAGFNLVSSAQQGQRRVIVALLGGRTAASRNAQVAGLMDRGLAAAPTRVATVPPASVGRAVQSQVAITSPLPTPRGVGSDTVETLISSLETLADDGDEPLVAEGAEAPEEPTISAMLPPPAPNREAEAIGWIVELGRFTSAANAAVHLETAPLDRVPGLSDAQRSVVPARGQTDRFAAQLAGLDGLTALTACAVLGSDGTTCTPIPPSMR
jgi:D-alanyl-D-alanine carboxypeptidase